MPFLSAHAGVIHCREHAEVGLFTFVHSRRAAYRRRFAPARYDVCAAAFLVYVYVHRAELVRADVAAYLENARSER